MLRRFALVGAAIGLIATPAWANVGIPMIALAWPAYWITYLPVVVIEGAIVRRLLSVGWRDALKHLAIANLISTLIGIPIVWLLLLGVEIALGTTVLSGELTHPVAVFAMTIVGAPWMPPVESRWPIYWAFVILAVSFCGASIFVEYRYLRGKFPKVEYADALLAVCIGNVTSYLVVCMFALLFPLSV